jgi:phage-related protein
MEHPIDPEGRWEYIRENNIVKAMGQLFTIRVVNQQWKGNSGKITCKADHIFYQLADIWIEEGQTGISARTVLGLFNMARERFVKEQREGQIWYSFYPSSNMTVPNAIGDNKWVFLEKGMTPIEFLMGSSGVMEICGGELHRDNFDFSLYERKQGSQDNAFEIRTGKNLRGIKRTIDISNLATYVSGENEYGDMWGIAPNATTLMNKGFPHYTVRTFKYEYNLKDLYYRDERALASEMLINDLKKYYNAYCAPLLSYDVDMTELKSNPEYADLVSMGSYKVGNRGIIWDDKLGKVEIEITQTTTDALTGEVTNVMFGNQRDFVSPASRTAYIDFEPEVVDKSFYVQDSEGAFCEDSEYYAIIEHEGV